MWGFMMCDALVIVLKGDIEDSQDFLSGWLEEI